MFCAVVVVDGDAPEDADEVDAGEGAVDVEDLDALWGFGTALGFLVCAGRAAGSAGSAALGADG